MITNLYIAKNVYGGDGLGRLGDGRVAFVPGAWAGEQVKAEIVEERRGYVKASLIEVVEASEERLYGMDGTKGTDGTNRTVVPGMVYAGLSYKGECEAKAAQLVEFLERARLNPSTIQPFNSSTFQPFNYRNKVVYHFAQQKGAWVIGYRAEPSHEIVDITEDPLARKEINAKLPEIRKTVLTLLTTGPERIRRETAAKGNLTIRWTKASGVKWWLGEAPKDLVLTETTLGRDFAVPAGGFYQVNPEVGEELVRAVVDEYAKSAASAPEVLDLYCGVGVFGLCANPPKLIGIESGRQAIEFAKRNADSLFGGRGRSPRGPDSPQIRFFAEEVGKNLRRIPINARTTVIVDPPRGGLEKGVAKWLASSPAPKIIYVSCDPATLVRDLKEICGAGRSGIDPYRITNVRWFNMFPRTARFETMVVLEKRS